MMNEKSKKNLKLQLLKRQLESGNLPHAYLFSGRNESSKNEVIDYIKKQFFVSNNAQNSDFHEIIKMPITIDDVREIKSFAYTTPIQNEKHIFLIRNIENLSRDAAPALLKLLEEAPSNAIILATTTNIQSLLPTILSRFSHLRFVEKFIQKDFPVFEKVKKLPLSKRFAHAAEIVKNNEFTELLNGELFYLAKLARENKESRATDNLKRALRAKTIAGDPTINKRMLCEYLLAIM